MSRKNRRVHSPKQVSQLPAAVGKRWMVNDSFANFEARVGYGTDNQSSAAGYQFDFISRNRVQLEAMYRSSWIVGQAVDVVAEDMTREGVEIRGELDPQTLEKLTKAEKRLGLWQAICDTIKWSRLYGGAVGVLLIDGQNMSTPLNLDSIGKGQFKGIYAMDRWLVQPSMNDLITELGPHLGRPRYYDIVADGLALRRQRIHYSRVMRLDGVDLPYWQRLSENLWGQSIIERLFDRLIAFDSTTTGAAQLVYKAYLRTYKVDQLRDIIATGGPALEGLVKQIEMIRRFQSNEGLTLMDSKDEMVTNTYTFAGLDDVLLQIGQQLAGALQIPLVRLFGQSPAGLNSTGESDLKTYYDRIKQEQERRLMSPVSLMYDILHRSELGERPDESFNVEFAPLAQLGHVERADVADKTTSAVTAAFDAGLISEQTALQELRQSSRVTGIFTNITDEQIEDADPELPKLGELGDPSANPDDTGRRAEPAADPESDPGQGRGDSVRAAA